MEITQSGWINRQLQGQIKKKWPQFSEKTKLVDVSLLPISLENADDFKYDLEKLAGISCIKEIPPSKPEINPSKIGKITAFTLRFKDMGTVGPESKIKLFIDIRCGYFEEFDMFTYRVFERDTNNPPAD